MNSCEILGALKTTRCVPRRGGKAEGGEEGGGLNKAKSRCIYIFYIHP